MLPLRVLALVVALLAGCQATQLRRLPDGAPALASADAVFDRGDYQAAAALYRAFLRQRPSETLIPLATYKLALSYYRLGAYETVLETLDSLGARFPQGDWVQVSVLYGDAAAALDRRVSALLWWERAWKSAGAAGRGAISSRIAALVGQLTAAERQHARKLAATDFVLRALDQGAGTGSVLPGELPPPRLHVARTPTVARAGVLLPLSGRNAVVGELSLDGIRMVFPAGDERLVIVDTGEDASRAVARLHALAGDPSVVAVLGPLQSRIAASVAPAAERMGLALLSLAQQGNLAGTAVLQTAMTRSLEARTLASFATGRLGLVHFAVLHPSDAYGERMAAAFRAAVESLGGEVVGTLAYGSDQRDFEPELERLEEWYEESRLEAVLLPDAAERAAFIGPQVRDRLPEVQLLGTSGWNNPPVLDGVATAMEGAVFAAGFFAASARLATRVFVERFRQRYGRAPGLLEAQAYDAAALVEQLLARQPRSREEMRTWLRDYGVFAGAAGDLEIWNGVASRRLFILRLHRGSIEEILPVSGSAPVRAQRRRRGGHR